MNTESNTKSTGLNGMTKMQRIFFVILLIGASAGGVPLKWISHDTLWGLPSAGVAFQSICLIGMLYIFQQTRALRTSLFLIICLSFLAAFVYMRFH
jgi:hypothetical protein